MSRRRSVARSRTPLFLGLLLGAVIPSCSLLTPTSDLLGGDPSASGGATGHGGQAGQADADADGPAVDGASDATGDPATDHPPPPTCSDKKRDGDETDVDCGGSCAKCIDGKVCKEAADCDSLDCLNAICQPARCDDTIANGAETDVDCGGGACVPCPDGDRCVIAADCVHGSCRDGVCAAATCADQLKDGTETDVDCGGTKCARCPDFKSCVSGTDCTSGVCAPDPNMAIPKCQPCADGKLDGTETDVDCGGGLCKPCPLQHQCIGPADCASGQCQNSHCRAKCGDACAKVGDCLSTCACNLTTKKCGM